jgi:four helix bundle protein
VKEFYYKKGCFVKSIVGEKSYAFAVKVVRLYQYLAENKKEFVLGKQVLRSGTSIGANIEEAIGAISKKEFISKIQIAYKEARETKYWLRLLTDTGYLEHSVFVPLSIECDELIRMIASILKTSKENEKIKREDLRK